MMARTLKGLVIITLYCLPELISDKPLTPALSPSDGERVAECRVRVFSHAWRKFILTTGIAVDVGCTTLSASNKVQAPEPFLPVPGEAQLKWHKAEYRMFIHSGMRSFYPSSNHKGMARRIRCDSILNALTPTSGWRRPKPVVSTASSSRRNTMTDSATGRPKRPISGIAPHRPSHP